MVFPEDPVFVSGAGDVIVNVDSNETGEGDFVLVIRGEEQGRVANDGTGSGVFAGGGGSQSVWQSFAFAFDTPGLATGIDTGIVVAAGQLYAWALSIPVAWETDDPPVNLNLYSTGDGPDSGGFGPFDATQTDNEVTAYGLTFVYASNFGSFSPIGSPIDAPLFVGVVSMGALAAGTAVLYVKVETPEAA